MSDFFPGPEHRPDVKEFWQLSEIVLRNDAIATEGEAEGFHRVVQEFVPMEVATYMGEQRVAIFLNGMGFPMPPEPVLGMMVAIWMDGFCAGAKYAKEYPKTDD